MSKTAMEVYNEHNHETAKNFPSRDKCQCAPCVSVHSPAPVAAAPAAASEAKV